MIIKVEEGKVSAIVGEDEFFLFDAGKQTKNKLEKGYETLGKLVRYEAAIEKARAEMAAPKKKAVRKKKAADPQPQPGTCEHTIMVTEEMTQLPVSQYYEGTPDVDSPDYKAKPDVAQVTMSEDNVG